MSGCCSCMGRMRFIRAADTTVSDMRRLEDSGNRDHAVQFASPPPTSRSCGSEPEFRRGSQSPGLPWVPRPASSSRALACTAGPVLLANLCCGMAEAWGETACQRLSYGGDGPFMLKPGEAERVLLAGSLSVPLGAVLAGALVDTVGRKVPLVLSPALVMTGACIAFFSSSVEMVYATQGCAGAAWGAALTTGMLYLCEAARPASRGALAALSMAGLPAGRLLQHLAGPLLCLAYRNNAALILGPATLAVSLFLWTPESPYFLAARRRGAELREALAMLRGEKQAAVEEEAAAIQRAADLDLEADGRSRSSSSRSRSESYWKAVSIVVVLVCALRLDGRDTVASNRAYFFSLALERPGIVPDAAQLCIQDALEVVGWLVCAVLVDHLGRRPLIVASSVLGIGCLSTAGAYLYCHENLGQDMSAIAAFPLMLLSLYTLMLGLGLQLPWLQMGELLPLPSSAGGLARAVVPAVAVSAHALLGPVVANQARCWELSAGGGKFLPFCAFAACYLAVCGVTLALVPETRAKTLLQVQAALRSRRAGASGARPAGGAAGGLAGVPAGGLAEKTPGAAGSWTNSSANRSKSSRKGSRSLRRASQETTGGMQSETGQTGLPNNYTHPPRRGATGTQQVFDARMHCNDIYARQLNGNKS